MTYCPIPSERSVKYIIFKKNLFYLKSTARATQNRLACHFGYACHRFASAALADTSWDLVFSTILFSNDLAVAFCDLTASSWILTNRDNISSILELGLWCGHSALPSSKSY